MLSILPPYLPLMVFGSDYDTEDGSAIRDYIHVKDLARAHLLALQHLEKVKKSEPINLGTGRGFSVFEVLEATERATGIKVPHTVVQRREGDIPVAVANAKKAKQILGFITECFDLDSMIESEWLLFQSEKL